MHFKKYYLLAYLLCYFTGIMQAQTIPPQDATLSRYNYPYPVHYITLNIQGQHLKMAYMDVQPTQPNGKVVMLLHGKNFCGAYWDSTAADLRKNGYRVIIPEVPYQSVDKWYQTELKQDYEKIKQYQLDNYYAGQWKPAYEKWARLLASWTQGPDYPRVAWNAALTYDMIFTQPVYYEFEHIQAPTLLIIGQRDRTALGKASAPEEVRKTLGNYPELGKNAAQRIPHGRLVPIDGAGHLPHIEAYEQFITALLEFLNQ